MADGLNSGLAIEDMTYIDGTVYRTRALDDSLPTLILPDFRSAPEKPQAICRKLSYPVPQYGPLYSQTVG